MKRGDIVVIFEDPLTEKKIEGKARLIRLESKDHSTERWAVKFLDDGMIVDRHIKIK